MILFLFGEQDAACSHRNDCSWQQFNGAMLRGSWLGPLTFLWLSDDLQIDFLIHKYVDNTALTEILQDRNEFSNMQTFFHQLWSWSSANDIWIWQKQKRWFWAHRQYPLIYVTVYRGPDWTFQLIKIVRSTFGRRFFVTFPCRGYHIQSDEDCSVVWGAAVIDEVIDQWCKRREAAWKLMDDTLSTCCDCLNVLLLFSYFICILTWQLSDIASWFWYWSFKTLVTFLSYQVQ